MRSTAIKPLRANRPPGEAGTAASSWPWGRLALAAVFVTAVAAFVYFDGEQYLSLEALKTHRDQLIAYTKEHYWYSVGIFILLYVAQSALSLPGSLIFTLAGGLLFGAVLGTVYDVIASTTGATLAFLASRYLFRDWIERRFGGRLERFQEGFKNDGFKYLLSIRLMPIFPYFVVNLLSGVTRIELRTYVLATLSGSIPVTFVYANAGQQIGRINELDEILSPGVLASLVLLALLALMPTGYRIWRQRRSR